MTIQLSENTFEEIPAEWIKQNYIRVPLLSCFYRKHSFVFSSSSKRKPDTLRFAPLAEGNAVSCGMIIRNEDTVYRISRILPFPKYVRLTLTEMKVKNNKL